MHDATELMGTGFLGELREGPDGQLYQWVEGIDGLGNPIGFWKRLARGLRRVARVAAPLARRAAGYLPGPYGAAVSKALNTATPWLQRAGLMDDGLGQLYQAPDGEVYQVQGLADGEFAPPQGVGALGEVREGEDGRLYQWVETVNGLGEPVGFWNLIKKVARRALPFAQKYAGFIPGYGTAISAGLKAASPWLRRAGIAEADPNGMAAPEDLEGLADGSLAGVDADLPAAEPPGDLEGYGPPNAPPSPRQPTHFTPLW